MPDRRRSPNCPVTRSGNPGQSPTDAWLTALLAAEVHRAIARIVGPRRLGRVVRAQPAFVLGWVERHFEGPEALEAGVRPHQRPIRAHVPTHEPRRQRTGNGRVDELFQQPRLVEAPPPVLAENRRIPRVLVQIEPHEPPQRLLGVPNQSHRS